MRRNTPLRRTPIKRTPMKRRARRGGAMPPEVYMTVMETRARGECELALPGVCTGQAEEWHHRQRRQRGNDTVSNGLAACHACHHHITHVSPAAGRAGGFIVHSHHPDPGSVPVYWRGSWWILTDDGQRVLAESPSDGKGA